MIIHLKRNTTKEDIKLLTNYLTEKNIQSTLIEKQDEMIIIVLENDNKIELESFYSFSFVSNITKISEPYKLVSKNSGINQNSIKLPYNNEIGNDNILVIAGPCTVESEDSLRIIAKSVKESGAKALRGGTYKLRTSPYSFQGLESEGLKILNKVGKEFELITVSEITDISQIPLFIKYVDIIQVGARNMYNYELLKELSKVNKPILLKRSFQATIEELLLAAEYLASNGKTDIILCERGIRTFETETRNTLDLGAVVRLKDLTFLPVIVDPSHASGRYEMVPKLSLASISAGADGIIVEVHDKPEVALSDGKESLKLDKFRLMMDDIKKISKLFGKKI